MKYAIIGALVLSLIAIVSCVPEHYRKQGRQEEITKYKIESARLLAEREREIAEIRLNQTVANEKVRVMYEQALDHQREGYERRIAANNLAGGLRFKPDTPTCTGQTETQSTAIDNDPSEIRLPRRIEQDLYTLVGKADQVKEQLNACQVWIKQQGFETEQEVQQQLNKF